MSSKLCHLNHGWVFPEKKKTRPRELKEQTNRLAVVSQSCMSELFKPIATCLPSGAHLTLVTGPSGGRIRRKLGQRTDKREMTEIEIESVGDREPPMVNCLDQTLVSSTYSLSENQVSSTTSSGLMGFCLYSTEAVDDVRTALFTEGVLTHDPRTFSVPFTAGSTNSA
nr:hypothetical protein EUGRSUZ_G03337 [Ipomoea batatas]